MKVKIKVTSPFKRPNTIHIFRSCHIEDVSTLENISKLEEICSVSDDGTGLVHEFYDDDMPQKGISYDGPAPYKYPEPEISVDLDAVMVSPASFYNVIRFTKEHNDHDGQMYYYGTVCSTDDSVELTMVCVTPVWVPYEKDGKLCVEVKTEDGYHLLGDDLSYGEEHSFCPVSESIPAITKDLFSIDEQDVNYYRLSKFRFPNFFKDTEFLMRPSKIFRLRYQKDNIYGPYTKDIKTDLVPVFIDKIEITRTDVSTEEKYRSKPSTCILIRKNGIFYDETQDKTVSRNPYYVPIESRKAVYSDSVALNMFCVQFESIPGHTYEYQVTLTDVYQKTFTSEIFSYTF